MKTITNDSGTFWVDAAGTLRIFQCAEKNYYDYPHLPDYRNEKHIYWLHIPEGVVTLPAGAFDGYRVQFNCTLPESLTALGDETGGVFRYASLGETLKFPAALRFVAEDAFFASMPHTVELEKHLDPLIYQKLKHIFRNQASADFLFGSWETVRNLPPLEIPTTELRNESGSFFVDSLGVLQSLCCSEENNADTCAPEQTNKLYTLRIPEGVTVLKAEAFRNYTVRNALCLPDSLQLLGADFGCAFANCDLPDVVLPESLKILGTFAFGGSSLRSLRLPNTLHWGYARQFKESKIGTLYLSEAFRGEENTPELSGQITGQGHLRSIRVNSVKIGNIVWEK